VSSCINLNLQKKTVRAFHRSLGLCSSMTLFLFEFKTRTPSLQGIVLTDKVPIPRRAPTCRGVLPLLAHAGVTTRGRSIINSLEFFSPMPLISFPKTDTQRAKHRIYMSEGRPYPHKDPDIMSSTFPCQPDRKKPDHDFKCCEHRNALAHICSTQYTNRKKD
jgi:hypothetical protein